MSQTTVLSVSMQISVIVPAYNAAHYLQESLPPLIAMREREEIIEVLVVDDDSSDSSAEVATHLGREGDLFRCEIGGGGRPQPGGRSLGG